MAVHAHSYYSKTASHKGLGKVLHTHFSTQTYHKNSPLAGLGMLPCSFTRLKITRLLGYGSSCPFIHNKTACHQGPGKVLHTHSPHIHIVKHISGQVQLWQKNRLGSAEGFKQFLNCDHKSSHTTWPMTIYLISHTIMGIAFVFTAASG